MTLTTDVHVVPGLTIPVETKSWFFPLSTGLTSAKSLREHSWLQVGVPYKTASGASLVAQWLRICLLMQGTWVRALVWEDPTCRGAAGPVSHNY